MSFLFSFPFTAAKVLAIHAEIKADLAQAKPYQSLLDEAQIQLEDLPQTLPRKHSEKELPILKRQQAFGYSQEDLRTLLTPMAMTGQEGIGSMGNDAPISFTQGSTLQRKASHPRRLHRRPAAGVVHGPE